MKIGIVVPHLFMDKGLLSSVIFSPADLALSLANGLVNKGHHVNLYTPGPVDTNAYNITADTSLLELELKNRNYHLLTLLKKHPSVFIALARQIQAEIIAKAFMDANSNELDIVHIYTNEEEIGLVFSKLCNKPVIYNHHDPFNFLIKYKSIMPKYSNLPWISFSYSQRNAMPKNTNWVANIYHGLAVDKYHPLANPSNDYIAYVGRIIEPKGLHLIIQSVKLYNTNSNNKLTLRIAGKHYSGHSKDSYWKSNIEPNINDKDIIYDGYIDNDQKLNRFIGNAKALIVPSIFEEPFGMVIIEALACGTPVIGLNSGAIPEIINNPSIGYVSPKYYANDKLNTTKTVNKLTNSLSKLNTFNRKACRSVFEDRFSDTRMCNEYIAAYEKLIK
jgi:glycosyltransferase involved in cell wall biosynthesis